MRFYTNQHPFYCGIDLHARSMYVCLLRHDGELLLHRNMQAAPEPFLKAVAPSREGLVIAVEGLFTWYGLADLCAAPGIPCVWGHALSMKASHGGQANNDTMDAHKIATLLRGGMLPQASGYPAARRATRAVLRRRTPLRRTRAELLAQVQQTTSQYHLPEIGKNIAYTANREGVAERFEAPAVPTTLAVALALLTSEDQRLSDLELFILKTATPHDAQTLYLLPTVPGIGTILRLVLLDDRHQSARFPRVQAVASYCRLIKCAKESGGKRFGTSGNKMGTAPLQGALSAAATLCRRGNEPGQKWLARWEKKPDTGQARSLLAHKLARAVSCMRNRHTACALEQCLRPSGSRAGEPAAALDPQGMSRHRTDVMPIMAASWNADVRRGPLSLSPAL